MSISIRCPNCDKRLKAEDELAGGHMKCPACRHAVAVPAARDEGSAARKAHGEHEGQGHDRRRKKKTSRRTRALRLWAILPLSLGLICGAALLYVHFRFSPVVGEIAEIDRKTGPELAARGVDLKSCKSWGERTNAIARALINDPGLARSYNTSLPKVSPFNRVQNDPVLDTICLALSFKKAVPAVQECCVRGFSRVFWPGIVLTVALLGLGGFALLWGLRN